MLDEVFRRFPVNPVVSDDRYREHVLSALGRRLPEVKPARPHGWLMSVAAGGPSLEDTWRELDGVVVAVNGSLEFLLERGRRPWAVGCFDPRPHMAEIIPAVDGVFYFIGSTCHPSLFDHLEGRQVIRWHPLGMPGMVDLIAPRTGIGGGTTMGLRWPTLGHYMGFRRFHLHGLDSSFRGGRTHAYDDYRDGLESLAMQGYRTSLNFMRQVADYREMLDMFAAQPPEDRVSIKLFGDGLLQHTYRDAQHHLRQPS